MYDVCAHSILPKSAILVLGLLKKKDKQFCVGGDTQQKKISGTSQAHFGSFKGSYQCGYYCRECLYSKILKLNTARKKCRFHRDFL